VRRWSRDHGLLLANVGLFLVFFVGMVLAGGSAESKPVAEPHHATGA
jgi:hypothetical protein